MDKITTLHVLKCVKYPLSLSIRVTFDMLSYVERSGNIMAEYVCCGFVTRYNMCAGFQFDLNTTRACLVNLYSYLNLIKFKNTFFSECIPIKLSVFCNL